MSDPAQQLVVHRSPPKWALAVNAVREQLETMAETLEKIEADGRPKPPPTPIDRPLAGVCTADGSTYMYIDLGGPTKGRVWDLRRVGVWPAGGADVLTQMTGAGAANVTTLLVIMSAVPPFGTAACVPFDDLVLSQGIVPDDAEFQPHQVDVPFGKRVVVVVKGLNSGAQVAASGQASELVMRERRLKIVNRVVELDE
jgi:hypothetical protein